MKNFFNGFLKQSEDVAEMKMTATANSIRNAFGSKPPEPTPTPEPTNTLAQDISSGVGKLMGR